VIGIAQLMVVLDPTIVNIALPSAQRALAFSTADRQWVITAYALAFGGLLLVGGRLQDLLGRKRTFIAGLAGFAVASAVGWAAPGFGLLVAARGSRSSQPKTRSCPTTRQPDKPQVTASASSSGAVQAGPSGSGRSTPF
jgi:MFS family permease